MKPVARPAAPHHVLLPNGRCIVPGLQMLAYLLDCGATVNTQDQQGTCALMYACQRNAASIVATLLEHEASTVGRSAKTCSATHPPPHTQLHRACLANEFLATMHTDTHTRAHTCALLPSHFKSLYRCFARVNEPVYTSPSNVGTT